MRHLTTNTRKCRAVGRAILLLIFLMGMVSCATIDPRQVDVELKEEPPELKITSFSTALTDLGAMTEIYGAPRIKIQSKDIADNTGTAGFTGGEIPRDITEMMKSTLNSIGGKLTFIPYNPSYMQNQMVTGYSSFDEKLIPDVVISGGITEFDRGLETRGSNIDAAASADWSGLPAGVPSNTTGLEYGAGDKFGLASITLDFNLIDFRTMSGIARMQTVNTIKVHKAVSEKELGITLFGPTFGLKGSIKKVQGRHAAVRMLVQLSMIQIVGKYLKLPYWKLLPNAEPDPVVIDAIKKEYYEMAEIDRLIKIQELLFIQGYDVTISGELDEQTIAVLQQLNPAFDPAAGGIDRETYLQVYTSVPIDDATMERRIALNKAYEELNVEATETYEPAVQEQYVAEPPLQEPPPQEAPAAQPETQEVAAAAPPPAPTQQVAATPDTTAPEAPGGATPDGIGGRMLSDDEW